MAFSENQHVFEMLVGDSDDICPYRTFSWSEHWKNVDLRQYEVYTYTKRILMNAYYSALCYFSFLRSWNSYVAFV